MILVYWVEDSISYRITVQIVTSKGRVSRSCHIAVTDRQRERDGKTRRGLRLLQGVKLEKEGLKIRDMVLGSDDWPTPSTVEVEQRVCKQHSLSNMCDNRKIERREKRDNLLPFKHRGTGNFSD